MPSASEQGNITNPAHAVGYNKVPGKLENFTAYGTSIPKSGEIALLLTDVDGTFINEEHLLSEENALAFKEANTIGFVAALATGRPPQSVISCFGPTRLEQMGYGNTTRIPGVFLNGAIVYGPDGTLLNHDYFQEKDFTKILKVLKDANVLNLTLVYTIDGSYCLEQNDLTMRIHTEYHEPPPAEILYDAGDSKSDNQRPIFFSKLRASKIAICGKSAQDIYALRPLIERETKGIAKCVQPLSWQLEVIPWHVNKLRGAQALQAYLGISPQKTLAIGDSENDLELIKSSGIGIAVANATDAVKQLADFETVHCSSHSFFHVLAHLKNVQGPPSNLDMD